jgi:hypothetical protein
MFISLAYLANRGGSASQVLAAELNRHWPFIYRPITIYLFEYNESNISLAPGSGSRIRYLKNRAFGVSPKAALTISDDVQEPMASTTKRCNKTGVICLT